MLIVLSREIFTTFNIAQEKIIEISKEEYEENKIKTYADIYKFNESV